MLVVARQPVGYGQSSDDDFVAKLLPCALRSGVLKFVEKFTGREIRFGRRLMARVVARTSMCRVHQSTLTRVRPEMAGCVTEGPIQDSLVISSPDGLVNP